MPRVPDAPQPQAGPDLDPTYLMMASGLAAEEAKARLFAMAVDPTSRSKPMFEVGGGRGSGSWNSILRQQRMKEADAPGESITAPAVKVENKILRGVPGQSHDELLKQHKLPDDAPGVDGFMTSKGRFVTRDQAEDIALKAGQVRTRNPAGLGSTDFGWDK